MSYPKDKPTGNYELRDYDFASNDSKKIPMDEYTFKMGYKNADESDLESVPDAHEQNWMFDVLHRNLRYTKQVAEENKKQLETKLATPTSIGQVKIGYGLEITSNGVLSVVKDIAQDANIISYDLPVGSYMLWAGKNAPEYFIEPKGQTLLRSSYPDLWEFAQSNNLVATNNTYVSGKLFGPGDGSTTFKVFDIRGKFIKIANDSIPIGTYEPAGIPAMPQHYHSPLYIQPTWFDDGESGSRFESSDREVQGVVANPNSKTGNYTLSATSNIYGKSETVTPENYALKIILKALPTPPVNAVPIGTILDYTANSAPDGYIMANGAELSRTTFSRLYNWAVANNLIIDQASIPATAHGFYGTGNGSTTFTIPDLRGVHKRGSDLASNRGGTSLGRYLADGLPNIAGKLATSVNRAILWDCNASIVASGAFTTSGSGRNSNAGENGNGSNTISFDASRSNAIYGKANQVQPKSVAVNYIIKY